MAKKKTQKEYEENLHDKFPQIKVIGKYINSSSKIECECTIDGYKWSAIATQILHRGCPICNGHYMNDHSFKERMNKVNDKVKVIGTYINKETPVKCICNICGKEFMGNIRSLLNGSTHSECRSVQVTKSKTKSHDWFIDKLNQKYPNEYDILSIYTKKKEPVKIRHKECGFEWETTPDSLLGSKNNHATCPKCSKVYKMSNKEYIDRLAKINTSIIPLEEYVNINTKILHKCKVCSYKWKVTPGALLNSKRGCPMCKGGTATIVVGFNDMWTTNPEMAKLLANPDDGYKYTQGTSKKVKFKCQNCGTISKPLSISKVKTRGFNCKCCSENRSLPNKIMYNILSYLNIEFKDEANFDWCKFKIKDKACHGIYDFYIPSLNLLIEMDGYFHYDYNDFSKQPLSISQLKDHEKDRLAIENGFEIIRIDCYDSDVNYIKEHILDSQLKYYVELNKIDWNYCIYHTIPNYIKDVWSEYNNGSTISELVRKYCKDCGTIRKYLKIGNTIGVCKYEVEGYHTEIICLDTMKKYNKISDAIRETGISSISYACKSKSHIAGKSQNGEPLHWMYYKDYLEKFKEVS